MYLDKLTSPLRFMAFDRSYFNSSTYIALNLFWVGGGGGEQSIII